jgi:hypothetical protein
MGSERYLDTLIYQGLFRFDHLSIDKIDNEPVTKVFSSAMLTQENCLFANSIKNGDDYCNFLHERLLHSLRQHDALPIARFADGEYAFYNYTLGCNGLYKQAQSIAAIKKTMPMHIDALKYLARHGLMAPLVFPDNSHVNSRRLFSLLQSKKDSSGAEFLDFINGAGIELNQDNYIPFYVVYAYLTSADFTTTMNGRKICILNSDYNETSCYAWFARNSSQPRIHYVPIPAEYVATRWEENKKGILDKIPPDTDLCLAGAGVGALLICADVAKTYSIPAIDAGHVLNMMNGRVDKSNGARLYTLRNQQ